MTNLILKADSDEDLICELITRGHAENDPERARKHYERVIDVLRADGVFWLCKNRLQRNDFIRQHCPEDVIEEHADYVTQDILCTLFKAMPQFRFESKVTTYFYGICNHKISKAIKKLTKELKDRPPLTTQPDPMDDLMDKIYEAVEALLNSKNQRERKDGELFQAHYMSQIPLRDLVEANPWMTKNRLRERLQRIKERIKREVEELNGYG